MSSNEYILIVIQIKLLLQINFVIISKFGWFLLALSTLPCHLYAVDQFRLLTHRLARQWILIHRHRSNISWHDLLDVKCRFLRRNSSTLLVLNHVLQLLLVHIINSFGIVNELLVLSKYLLLFFCFVVRGLLGDDYSLGGLATLGLFYWSAYLHRGFELRGVAV